MSTRITSFESAGYHRGSIYNAWINVTAGDTRNIIISTAYDGVCTAWLKIELPAPASAINVSFKTGDRFYGVGRVYYKLLTSIDSGYVAKTGTSGADGSFANERQYEPQSISIPSTLAAGTYYICFWAVSSNSDVFTSTLHVVGTGDYAMTITYDELQGMAEIDDGTAFAKYTIWIDNGSIWEQYAPYIDNGSSWELYGG